MSTYDELKLQPDVEPVLGLHISGLNKIWWTRKPSWSVAGWDYYGGLLPAEMDIQADIPASIETLGDQIEETTTLVLQIQDHVDGYLADMFALQKGTSEAASSQLSTNNWSAGEGMSYIDVESEIKSAPASSGTLYVDTETITYSSKAGNRFSTVARGRYHHLSSSLTEETFIPELSWDDDLEAPPIVSTRPTQLRGRWVTVIKSFFDPQTGDVLPASEHEVIWRGRLTLHSYQGGGVWQISAESIMRELDQDFFRNPVSLPLRGYSVNGSTGVDALPITIYQDRVYTTNSSNSNWDNTAIGNVSKRSWSGTPLEQEQVTIWVDITTNDTVGDLVLAINEALMDKYSAGSGDLLTAVSCGLTNQRVRFEQPAEAWYNFSAAPHWIRHTVGSLGTAHAYMRNTVRLHPALSRILGFSTSSEWTDVVIGGDLDNDEILTRITNYTTPNHAAKHTLSTVAQDAPLQMYFEPPRGYFSGRIPLDGGDDNPYETVGDGSPLCVSITDGGVAICSRYDVPGQYLTVARYGEASLEVDTDPVTTTIEKRTVEETATHAWWPTNSIWYDNQKYLGVHILMLRIMLSTGDMGRYNSVYDELAEFCGLAIPEDFVDTESFWRLSRLPTHALERDYVFVEPTNFREWLKTECQLLGMGVVQKNGKLTMVDLKNRPTRATATYTIDDTVRTTESEIAWYADDEDVLNVVTLKYDWDVAHDDFRSTDHIISRAPRGRVPSSIEIEARGVRSHNWDASKTTTSAFRQHINDTISRSSSSKMIYECTCNRSVEDVALCDYVLITDQRIPNPWTGELGVTELPARVVSKYWNIYEGTVELRCLVFLEEQLAPIEEYPYMVQPKSWGPLAAVNSVSGQTVTLSNTGSHDVWAVGDRVQLTELATGDSTIAEIESVDVDTLTLSRNVHLDQNAVLSPADIHYSAGGGDRDNSWAMWADPAGKISQNIKGSKNG